MNKRSTPTLLSPTNQSTKQRHSQSHSHSHSHPPSTPSPLPLSRPSSRSGTPRSITRNRESANMTTAPPPPSDPPTPTPKKQNRPSTRKKNKDQRNRSINNKVLKDDDAEMPAKQTQEVDLGSSENDQALFDLLGIPTPPAMAQFAQTVPEKGVLRLSEEGMEAARTGQQHQSRRGTQTNRSKTDHSRPATDGEAPTSALTASRPRGQENKGKRHAVVEDGGATSEGEPRRSKRLEGKHPIANGSGTSRRGGQKSSKQPFDTQVTAPISLGDGNGNASVNDPMDMTCLSRSLPSGLLPPKQVASGWDMPPTIGPQELTWQQKLQALNEETPSKRSSKPPTSDRKRQQNHNNQGNNAKINNNTPIYAPTQSHGRPQTQAHPGMHMRRASLDHVSLPSTNTSMTSSSSLPISTFDSSIPFYTGFNVHRAPQTPAKTVALRAMASGQGAGSMGPTVGFGGMSIMGEFPRLKGKTGSSTQSTPNSHSTASSSTLNTTSTAGMKYAGPTFHNSPHAGNLPKPDLDDF